MSNSQFSVKQLAKEHDRRHFESGSDPLDRYLREQATQDVRRRLSTCFVALDDHRVVGYYTLSSASILLTDLPETIIKKLPRYPTVPAVRMGRLAVDRKFKGKGLGGALLADALKRVCLSDIAAYALIVDAKDALAVSFYKHHGFLAFPESPMTLFSPLETVSQLK